MGKAQRLEPQSQIPQKLGLVVEAGTTVGRPGFSQSGLNPSLTLLMTVRRHKTNHCE